jgi:hypothetical protein
MRRLFALLAVLAALTLPAASQTPTGAAEWQRLYFTGTLVNCACASTSTAENLATYTLPAGILANAGDTIHIVAGGVFAASTDTKSVTVKIGSQTPITVAGATAGANRWYSEVWLTKSAANVQTFASVGAQVVNTSGTNAGTTSQNDTAAIVLAITALNATATTAGSISLQYLAVDFIRGS